MKTSQHNLLKNLFLSGILVFMYQGLEFKNYAESVIDPAQKASDNQPVLAACHDSVSLQIQKITPYEQEKERIFSLFQKNIALAEPKTLLVGAEENYQEFGKTGCDSYLFESLALYQAYYNIWRKSPIGTLPISYSTNREYKKWVARAVQLPKRTGNEVPPAYGWSPQLFHEMEEFKYELVREQVRVENLLTKRDRLLYPSIVGLTIGVGLTVLGGLMQHFDGAPTGSHDCTYGGISQPCLYNFHPPLPAFVIGLGLAFTIGGATGIGISAYQANHASSPAVQTP